jgi:hypothetical protein
MRGGARMTPEKLAAMRQRVEDNAEGDVSFGRDEVDELLVYVGELQGLLGRAFGLYLDSLMDMRLDDGESVMNVLFAVDPNLRDRLVTALSR